MGMDSRLLYIIESQSLKPVSLIRFLMVRR